MVNLKRHHYSSEELKRRISLGLFFLGFFYLFYAGAALTADLIPWRFNVGFDFERSIPFIPETALIYLSVSGLMLLALFLVKPLSDLKALVRVLCLQTLIGAACFLLFPVANNFPPRPVGDDLPGLFLLADMINLNNNEVPSLHVCFAFTLAAVLGQSVRWRLRILLLAWAVVIALSTLTLHEHNLVDGLAGSLLAVWGVRQWRRISILVKKRQTPVPLLVETARRLS
jgi:membrane-associated phospholipid phosphatase